MTARSRHWLKNIRTLDGNAHLGTTEHECGPHDFSHVALVSGPKPDLKTATGALLKHYGQRTVDFWCQGEELRVKLTVVDVKRPITSVSRLRGHIHPTWQAAPASSRRNRRGTHVSWWIVRSASPSCLPPDVVGTCG